MTAFARGAGYTVLELILVAALSVVMGGFAVPLTINELDDARAAGAARHLASRLLLARQQAAQRSVRIALRFERVGDDYVYATYQDGNNNGVLTRDIRNGIDTVVTAPERVGHQFPGIRFGVLSDVIGIDTSETLSESGDPVQIGAADMVSFSPDGSGSSGTVYLRSRRRQTAVRVLGATGRVRTLAFDFVGRAWRAQ